MTEMELKLNGVIARLERQQGALGLNHTQFVLKYPVLGSPKTWTDRLIPRAFKELGTALPKWLKKLEALVGEIDGRSPVAEFYPEMPFNIELTKLFHRLQ